MIRRILTNVLRAIWLPVVLSIGLLTAIELFCSEDPAATTAIILAVLFVAGRGGYWLAEHNGWFE